MDGVLSKKNLRIIFNLVIGISSFLPYLSVSFRGSSLSKSLMNSGDGVIMNEKKKEG